MGQVDLNSMSITDLAKHFIEVNIEKARAEEKVKALNKEINFIDNVLADRMLKKNQKELIVDDIKITQVMDEQFQLEIEGVEKPKWDDPDGPWFQWLKDIGEDGLIKVKESVHHATRDSFLKEWRKNKKDLPDFIKMNIWKHCKFNQAEIKRRPSK